MTGVLTTGQPFLLNLQQELPVLLENEVEKSKRSRLFQPLPLERITPPEFIGVDGIPRVTLSAIAQNFIEQDKTFIDSLAYPRPEPEFIAISEATTGEVFPVSQQTESFLQTSQLISIPKLLLSSHPLSQLKTSNKNAILNASYRHQKQYILADSSPQQLLRRNTRTTPIENYKSSSLPTLGFGSTGTGVRILQRLLVLHGYTVPIDGIFGALTESAVKAFQSRQNLVIDGIVGQKTWYQLTF